MTSPLLEWRPIDTCPLDGERVLLSEGVQINVGRWRGTRKFGRWSLETAMLIGAEPTYFEPAYWMPLPEPPKNERAV